MILFQYITIVIYNITYVINGGLFHSRRLEIVLGYYYASIAIFP